LAKAGKELFKRLTAPEIGGIVREGISSAVTPLEVKIGEMDRRISSEMASLRRELQYAPKVAVLEAKLSELEKKISAH